MVTFTVPDVVNSALRGEQGMTAVADPEAQVQVADQEDVKAAISNALKRAGCSFDELAEQARSGHYSSTRARLAWMAIGDLYGVNL